MAMSSLTAYQLLRQIVEQDDKFPDFFSLTFAQKEHLEAEAEAQRYRKPKTAQGSRARAFYEFLMKRAIAHRF